MPDRPPSTSGRRPRRDLGPGFRALFTGTLITNTGDGIRLAAVPLLATQLTSSDFVIASITAAQYLPWLTFAPIGGVVVDRSDRRRLIVSTQAFRGVLMAVLAILVLTDAVSIWQLCVVAFAITAGEILVDPAITALVPTVVDDEQLDAANGQISGAEIVTNEFVGPPAGAALFAWAPWIPMAIDALSYLASTIPLRRLPPSQPTSGRPGEVSSFRVAGSFRVEARAGFDHLRTDPVLGPLTAAQVVYFFGVSSGLSLTVVLVTVELDASSFDFGLVLATGALGAFLGALAGGSVAAALGRQRTLAGSVVVQGLGLIALAVADAVWQALAISLLAGIAAGVQRPVSRSMQQRLTPNHLLGRVNVAARAFTRGVIVVGALFSGVVAELAGTSWAFGVGGAIELVAAVGMWRALRTIDDEAA